MRYAPTSFLATYVRNRDICSWLGTPRIRGKPISPPFRPHLAPTVDCASGVSGTRNSGFVWARLAFRRQVDLPDPPIPGFPSPGPSLARGEKSAADRDLGSRDVDVFSPALASAQSYLRLVYEPLYLDTKNIG